MTENEAQKWLERFEWDDSEETSEALATICEALQEYPQFKAIGTIEKFKSLKEKSVAKKPHSISIANDIGNSMVECPICHANSDYAINIIKSGYCWKCGQKLEW